MSNLSPSTNKQNATDKLIEHLQRTHEEFIVLYHNTTADIVCLLLLDFPQSFLGLYYMAIYNVTDLVFIICLTIQLISLGLFASSISTRTHAKKLISVTQKMFEEQERAKSENTRKYPFRRRTTTFADDDDFDSSCTTESNRSRSAIAGFKFPTVPNFFSKDSPRKYIGKSKSPQPSPSPNSIRQDPVARRGGESPRKTIRKIQSAPQINVNLKSKPRRSSKFKKHRMQSNVNASENKVEKGERDHGAVVIANQKEAEGEERGEISVPGIDFDESEHKPRTRSNSRIFTANISGRSNTPRHSITTNTSRHSNTNTPRHSNTVIHSNTGTPRHSNNSNISKRPESSSFCSQNSSTLITATTPSKTSRKLQFVQTKQRRHSGRLIRSSHSNSRSVPKCPTLSKNASLDSIGSLKLKSKPGRENPSKPGTPVSMSVKIPRGDCS